MHTKKPSAKHISASILSLDCSFEQPNTKISTKILKEERARFTSAIRDLSSLYGQLSDKSCESLSEYMTNEFRLILQHPKIVSINVLGSPDRLRVQTTELCCTDPRTNITHSIGEFQITLYLKDPKTVNPVLWENLTRKVTGLDGQMEAPHIFAGGAACLGNMEGVFEQLVQNGEYSTAIDMAVQFVETVNVEDNWGPFINRWPIAPSSVSVVLASAIEKNTPHAKGFSKEELEKYRTTISSTIRDFDLLRTRVLSGDIDAELKQQMAEEFLLILNHPQITGITVQQDRFSFTTTELCCTDPRTNKVHSIGCFEISILFRDGSLDKTVHWKNLSRIVTGYDGYKMAAPHVRESGYPCIGNMKGVYAQLVCAGEYFAAADMAIRFIESVTIEGDHWGPYITQWPIAGEDK